MPLPTIRLSHAANLYLGGMPQGGRGGM